MERKGELGMRGLALIFKDELQVTRIAMNTRQDALLEATMLPKLWTCLRVCIAISEWLTCTMASAVSDQINAPQVLTASQNL